MIEKEARVMTDALVGRFRRRLAQGGLALMLGLSGCVGPTPYQPAVDGQGYRDQALEEDRYRVAFSGNSQTPRETVENSVLFRAAELTLQTGHDWFRIVEQDTAANTAYRTTVSTFLAPGIAPFPYYVYGGPLLMEADSRPVTRFEAIAIISVRTGERPTGDDQAYDAATVMRILGPKIVRPQPVAG